MKGKVPRLKTDEEAEAFLEQDLSDLDFSQFKPVRFEFEEKAIQDRDRQRNSNRSVIRRYFLQNSRMFLP